MIAPRARLKIDLDGGFLGRQCLPGTMLRGDNGSVLPPRTAARWLVTPRTHLTNQCCPDCEVSIQLPGVPSPEGVSDFRRSFGSKRMVSKSPIFCFVFLAVYTVSGAASLADELQPVPMPGAQIQFDQVKPLLAKYCGDCHQGEKAQGALDLVAISPVVEKWSQRKTWRKVHDYVRGSLMPPSDVAQPTAEERKLMADWMAAHPLVVECQGSPTPGHVTLRRLTRYQYANTIRDLLGIEFNAAHDFPADDVGYGFDSIGDVLTIPPLLLERYLSAAEAISKQAIVTPDMEGAPRKKHDYVQHSRQREELKLETSQAGKYLIRVNASADQAGPDKAKFGIWIGEEKIAEHTVAGANREEYEWFASDRELPEGKQLLRVEFLNDYYQPNDPDPKLKGDRNLYLSQIEIVGPIGVLPKNLPASHVRIFEPAAGDLPEPERAERVLKALIRRAWRRPPASEDIDRMLRLFALCREQGDSFERATQICLQAILVSPRFLFRMESEPADGQPSRTLDEHELAVRLSYFLWSTMPDETLTRLADEGKLREQLEPQVKRMLLDAKAEATITSFVEQWLHLRSLDQFSPDPRRFPGFDKELREAMAGETLAFLNHLVKEDRSVLEMLDANYTFANERLAKHYGIENINGKEMRRIDVDPARRGGLVTQASFLAVTSNPGRTSPVKRGKWILDNLLAAPPPPAPPNVPAFQEVRNREATASLRQRFEMHRADPMCASCHKQMDPLGFGLENFDAVGAWRDKDGKFDIDASGELPTGEKFAGPKELKAILRGKADDFRRCLSEKLMTFALGRGIELEDECLLRGVTEELKKGDDRFSALVLAIVRCEAFQKQGRRESEK